MEPVKYILLVCHSLNAAPKINLGTQRKGI